MDYDPIKDRLGRLTGNRAWLMRIFYAVLQVFFLRAWYVRRELRRILGAQRGRDRVRVLDAGSGFGQFSHFIARRFPNTRIVAVDVKEDYLERSRCFFDHEGLSGVVTFSIDDLTELKAEGPFHLILSVDVMEHILEDELVFRNFRRVAAPGGMLVINTPSDQGGSGVTDEGGESFIGEHVRDGYPPAELESKLASAGFRCRKILYTYGKSGAAAWKLLIRIPMTLLSASPLFVLLLPVYYLPVFPVGMLLNALDMRRANPTGTSLIVVAEAV